MSRRERTAEPQTIHHVIQRGNNRNYIYENTRDKREFLSILTTALTTYDTVLLQYVLMDNHYHLLVRLEDQPLSDFVRLLNRNYSLYYNQRYNRIGTIYGDRYKSYLLTEKEKFFSTVRYIVRNPVKAGLSPTPAQYLWSGHASVLDKESSLINRAELLAYFSPDEDLALKRYVECTEHETWTAQVGFSTIIDRRMETEERLRCLFNRLLSERNLMGYHKMILSGTTTKLSRELRNTFILLAIADAHTLKDIAAFLHISHERVRRVGKQASRYPITGQQ